MPQTNIHMMQKVTPTLTQFADRTQTREGWLLNAIEYLRAVFETHDYVVPKNIRVAIGVPYQKSYAGVIFGTGYSDDKHYEIFVTPAHADSLDILSTLTHELCHAVVGIHNQHNKVFAKCAKAMGLGGKMRATTRTEMFDSYAKFIVDTLGEIPHARCDIHGTPRRVHNKADGTGEGGDGGETETSAPPAQTNRWHKLTCSDEKCGVICRMTKTNIAKGLPVCCCGRSFKIAD